MKTKIRGEIIPILSSYFYCKGGYEAIITLFEIKSDEIAASGMATIAVAADYMPLKTLLQVLKVISLSCRDMRRDLLDPLVERSIAFTAWRLSKVSEKEVKEFDGFLASKIREKLQDLGKLHSTSSLALLQRIDVMDLAIAVKLLSSQYLNKKIQGLNEISEMLSDVRTFSASRSEECVNVDRRTTEEMFAR